MRCGAVAVAGGRSGSGADGEFPSAGSRAGREGDGRRLRRLEALTHRLGPHPDRLLAPQHAGAPPASHTCARASQHRHLAPQARREGGGHFIDSSRLLAPKASRSAFVSAQVVTSALAVCLSLARSHPLCVWRRRLATGECGSVCGSSFAADVARCRFVSAIKPCTPQAHAVHVMSTSNPEAAR